MRRPRSFLGAEQQARGERGGDGGPLPLFAPHAPAPAPAVFPAAPRELKPRRLPNDEASDPFARGMDASAGSAAARWTGADFATVDAAIRALAARGRFTADDVWSACPNVPVGKGLAARLNAAARAGVIRNTGETTIARRGGEHDHAQRLTVWVGGRA